MQKIEVSSVGCVKNLYGKKAEAKHCKRLIKEPAVIYHDGHPFAVYGDWPHTVEDVLAILSIKCLNAQRRAAVQGTCFHSTFTKEQYFGFSAARPVFNVPPGRTKATRENFSIYENHIVPSAVEMDKLFAEYLTEMHIAQVEETADIGPDWRIGNTTWTQCVVNDSNDFGYHYDRNNVHGTANGMFVFSSGVSGGSTCLPEFGVRFAMTGSKYLIFKAQDVLHGVTEIKKIKKNGFRRSVVYYAHKLLKGYKGIDEELEKFHKTIEKRLDQRYWKKRKSQINVQKQKVRKSLKK